MDSTTIKTIAESVVGPLITKALEARPDNGFGYGIALAATLVACAALGAAIVHLYTRSGRQAAGHIAALNKQIKEQAVCAEKVQAIEGRLNEHRGENSDRLYKLQLEEIGKRDATREHILGIIDKDVDGLKAAIDTRIGGLESRLGAIEVANQSLRESILVIQLSKNNPPKEGG